MRHLMLAVVAFVCVTLGAQSEGAPSDVQRFDVVVTLVDQDIYLASPDPATYPDARPGQIHLRTTQCSRKSNNERAVIAGYKDDNRAWLIFYDEQMCEVINVSEDRGGI